jgi:hypothetical protein
MKIAFIGTYPPQECGIGTFTNNLFNSVVIKNKKTEFTNDSFVVALNDVTNIYEYPEEVKLTIRQEHQEDYLQASKYINLNGADFVYSNMSSVFLAARTGYTYCPCCTDWRCH